MDLDAFRKAKGMTWQQVADLIGARSPRQARAWGLGIERPSERQRDHIEQKTGGVVTVMEMLRVRLAWERKNKRPLFKMRPPRCAPRGRSAA